MSRDEKTASGPVPEWVAPTGLAERVSRFSDMQWYMYRQRNVVFYAAFADQPVDAGKLATMVGELVARAPQLIAGFGTGPDGARLDAPTLAAITTIKTCKEFERLPDTALGTGFEVFDDPCLPMFRVTGINRPTDQTDQRGQQGGTDKEGRAALVVVRVSHALVEGADSASLTQSRSINRARTGPRDPKSPAAPWHRRTLANVLAHIAVPLHLVVALLRPPDKRRFVFKTLALARPGVRAVARKLEVSQRAVLFALVFAALFDLDGPAGKKRLTSLYSVLDRRKDLTRDPFIRMRMLQTGFARADGLVGLVHGVEATLIKAKKTDSGVQQEISAASVAVHRRLEKLLPGLYSERIFSFIPFDLVIGLIPPHSLGGPLTEGLMEPVYCGTTTPGLVSCVIVPNRRTFSFGLYMDEARAGRLAQVTSKLAMLAD